MESHYLLGGEINIIRHYNPTLEILFKTTDIPIVTNGIGKINVGVNINGFINHLSNGILNILAIKHLVTLTVNEFTLFIHNIIVLKHVFTDGEVHAFLLALSALNRLRKHTTFQRHILINLQGIHH